MEIEPNEKDKKDYELGYMAKDETVPAAITAMVRAHGGEINLEAPANRMRLAYEIKKEQEAFFGFTQFTMDPGAIKGLSDALNLEAGVLRFIIVTPPPMKDRRRVEGQRPSADPEKRQARPIEAKVSAPLSNEELEKTIEEILQ